MKGGTGLKDKTKQTIVKAAKWAAGIVVCVKTAKAIRKAVLIVDRATTRMDRKGDIHLGSGDYLIE